MKLKRIYLIIILVILFLATLYLVCYGPWSSSQIEKYNNGYGTFDMKSYDAVTVYQVLDQMQPEGFTLYKKYFYGDSIFTLVYGILQIVLLLWAYNWSKSKALLGGLSAVPVIRGLCDLIENQSLHYIITDYPQKHAALVCFTANVTYLKLRLVALWVLLLVIGIIVKYLRKRKKKGHDV